MFNKITTIEKDVSHISIFLSVTPSIHNGILCSVRKDKIMQFSTTSVEPEDIVLNKFSESNRDKYRKIISLICGI